MLNYSKFGWVPISTSPVIQIGIHGCGDEAKKKMLNEEMKGGNRM